MTNVLLGIVVLAVLALAFGWMAVRALRGAHGWIRWLGGLLSALLTLILAAVTIVAGVGAGKLFRRNIVSVPGQQAGSAPEQIARGEHIAKLMCAGCHSENGDLPLEGGENMSEEAGLPFGDIYAPNLTPGGDIKNWTDADLFRTLRTGVDDEGRATAMTLVKGPQMLSDEDTLAVIAYLRQSPAVDHETPPFKPSVLMAILSGSGLIPFNVPSAIAPIASPAKAATAEYGGYVAAFMDCTTCHGANLDGKVPPPYPPGPNLQADFTAWSGDDFAREVRTHAAAAEQSKAMPWKDLAKLDEVELQALYLYLHEAVSK